MAAFPVLSDEIAAAHFIVSDDIERSKELGWSSASNRQST